MNPNRTGPWYSGVAGICQMGASMADRHQLGVYATAFPKHPNEFRAAAYGVLLFVSLAKVCYFPLLICEKFSSLLHCSRYCDYFCLTAFDSLHNRQ